jgi:mevalonate kinase
VALLRALASARRSRLAADELNAHAFALEQIAHGSPSGIDNTTVTHERPVWFKRGEAPRFPPAPVGADAALVLASSGQPGSTRDAVARVCSLREARPREFEELCARAEAAVRAGCAAFEAGDPARLGAALDELHALLSTLGVSAPALDRLVAAARAAGALGAKLTGSGGGGFVIALARREGLAEVERALQAAGATATLRAELGGEQPPYSR